MRRSLRTVALVACALVSACFDGAELTEGQPCDPLNPVCGGDQQCLSIGEGSPTCTDVASANCDGIAETDCASNCAAQMQACVANSYCVQLGECVAACTDQSCIDYCRSYSYPDGVATLDALANCQACCADVMGDTGADSASEGPGTSTTAGTTGMSTSTSTTGGSCQGSSCAAGETCCEGTTCVYYAEGDSRCESTCSSGGECSSCCCVQLQDMVTSACVDASYCGTDVGCSTGCAISGSQCGTDDDCCDASPYGSICIENSGMWYSCFKLCSTGSDCSTGCCNYNSVISQYICETC